MQNLVIDKQKAKQLYPTASSEFKAILEDSFSKAFFSNKITDRVKTVADAYEVLGKSQINVHGLTTDEIAYLDLKVIVEALNEGWQPDWGNSNDYKYYPWFYLNKPGFRLSTVDYNCADSGLGSRLCFKSEALAKYAATQFFDLYKAFLS